MPSFPGGGDQNVRGTYTLDAGQARRELRGLDRDARMADRSIRQLGGRLDRMPEQARGIRTVRAEMRGLARDGVMAERALTTAMRRKTAEVNNQRTAVRRLRADFRELGAVRASPKVDLDGVVKARAEIAALRRELRQLNRESASPKIGATGGGPRIDYVRRPRPGAAGAGGGGPAGSAGGGLGSGPAAAAFRQVDAAAKGATSSVAGFAGGIGRMGLRLSLILPIIQSVVGAVGALSGVLASAGAGAGALGIGGIGALAVGLTGIAAVAIPVKNKISEIFKAQTQLNTAQKDTRTISQEQEGAMDRVRNATQSLQSSQDSARSSQVALTQARRDARRALIDMSLAADRSRLSERRAGFELVKARREYQRIQLDPTASTMDVKEARLALDDATLGKRSANIDKRRAVADNGRTQRAGVNGSESVIQASIAARQAAQAVANSVRELSRANRDQARGPNAVANARDALNKATKGAPKGTLSLISEARTFAKEWRKATRESQGNLVGFLRSALRTANRLRPVMARVSSRATGALRKEGKAFGESMTSDTSKTNIDAAGQMFAENLTQGRRFLAFTLEALGNIMRASRPFLHEMSTTLANYARGWARGTRDIDKTRGKIRTMYGDLKLVGRVLKDAAVLLGDIFSAGRGSGAGMLENFDRTLNRWDAWIKANPEKVKGFFDRTVNSFERMADAVASIVNGLNTIATALSPILDKASTLAGIFGDLSAMNPALPGILLATRRAFKNGGGPGGGPGGGGGGGSGGAGGAAAGARAAFRSRFVQNVKGSNRRGLGRIGSAIGAEGGVLATIRNGFKGGGAATGRVGRVVGKAALPITAIFAALDAANAKNVDGGVLGAAQRGEAAFNGATFGGFDKLLGALGGRTGKDRQDEADRKARNLTAFQKQMSLQREGGRTAGEDIFSAMDIVTRRKGVKAGRQEAKSGFASEFRSAGLEGKRELTRTVASWIGELEKGDASQRKTARILARSVAGQWQSMGRRIAIVNGQILQGSRSEWDKISDALGTRAESALQRTQKAFTKMQDMAVGSLQATGMTKGQAIRTVRAMESTNGDLGAAKGIQASGERGRAQAAAYAKRKASGGRIGGFGMQDNVAVAPGHLAAPGELIVNRHTERRLLSRGVNLDAEVRGETRRHSAPVETRSAKGGRVGGLTTAMSALNSKLSSMGFRPGSTTGGTHAPNSYHYRGMATDYGNATNDMGRLWSVLYPKRRQFAELFGPQNLRPGPTLMHNGVGFQSPSLQQGHNDHIHVAVTGSGGALGNLGSGATAGGGGGGGPIKIKVPKIAGRGVATLLGQRYAAAYATGLEGRLNKTVGATPGGGGSSSNLGAGVSGSNQQMGREMMLRMGWGSDQWPALKTLWTGESGWNEGARNPSSGAYGIPQSLPASKMGPAAQGTGPAAAKAQIGWGLKYIKERYKSPSGALSAWNARSPHWYAKGGRVPAFGGWFAKGGGGDFSSPTMIGVGDKQPSGIRERVTVDRVKGTNTASAGGGSGIVLHMNFGDVSVADGADFKRFVAEAAEETAARLLKAIQGGRSETEDQDA